MRETDLLLPGPFSLDLYVEDRSSERGFEQIQISESPQTLILAQPHARMQGFLIDWGIELSIRSRLV